MPDNGFEISKDEKVIDVIVPSKKLLIAWVAVLTVVSALSAGILLPVLIIYVLYERSRLKTNKITITTERLIICLGVLNLHNEELELGQIKAVAVTQDFSDRILNSGNLRITPVDANTRKVIFNGIDNALEIKEKLSRMCREARKEESAIDTESALS